MNNAMVDDVLAAITALVVDESANGNPATKFRNISRICQHADRIRKLGISRVAAADALIQDGDGNGDLFVQGFVAAKDPKSAHATLVLLADAERAYEDWRRTRTTAL